ncbi:MAG: alanine racemase [Candidatus Acididesulfobacter guangdongensis]|uniref:Alanine racemase n=1 Tax=Acididesulfobacter guangdongensis TaxID=2597225 RepID=A0A519BJF3_ACIG2|nr:MAG: alanine racemase [Candidatus Acididesulfobacter guangdongensis]
MDIKEAILEINLKNLSNNIQQLKLLEFNKNKTIIAIIKSDAYGHGLLEVALILEKEGINFFGVIKLEDAVLLKSKLNNPKVLLLSGVDEKNIPVAAAMDISVCVYDLNYLKSVYASAKTARKKVLVHLKYDSGMNRLGFKDDELYKALDYIEEIRKNDNFLEFEGIFSHFSSAESDIDYTKSQLNNYKNILKTIYSRKLTPLYSHISASSSILSAEIKDDFSNSVRPGISLYGINPINQRLKCSNAAELSNNKQNKQRYDDAATLDLKPLMTLKTGIIQIKQIKKGCFVSYGKTFQAPRDMTIGVVNAGYDNGIPRMLSNKGRVIIDNQYADIIGVITMNMTIVDMTEIKNASLKSEVIILGESKSKKITVEEIADYAGTIPYEICLNVGKSNRRIYINIQ